MPRTKRIIPENAALHIMCIGNNKQHVFYKDEDKFHYYSLLKKSKQKSKIDVFHYCLMNNHLHLIVWTSNQSILLRFTMQANLSYFYYYKNTYEFCVHFWQNRFKSNIIDTDSYLLQWGKYIELNPIRAGLASEFSV